jgi:hypothetical protein
MQLFRRLAANEKPAACSASARDSESRRGLSGWSLPVTDGWALRRHETLPIPFSGTIYTCIRICTGRILTHTAYHIALAATLKGIGSPQAIWRPKYHALGNSHCLLATQASPSQ